MTQITVYELDKDTQIQKIKEEYLTNVGQFTGKGFKIEDEKTANQITDTIKFLKDSIKEVIARRKKLTKGIDDSKTIAMKHQHAIVEPMENDIATLTPLLNNWLDEKEKFQLEEERRLRQIEIDKKIKLQNEILENEGSELALKDAIKIDEDIKEIETAPIIKKSIVQRSSFGSAHRKETWHIEVEDFSKLPDEYKLPNQTVLNGLVRGKNGLRKISGCKIWMTKDLVSRK